MRTRSLVPKFAGAVAVAITALTVGQQVTASADTSPDLALEQQLADLSYDPGPVDGSFDDDTAYAISAFQRVHGMARTGEASGELRSAVAASTTEPAALVPDGGANRVEVDLGRQVLFLYENGTLLKTLPVSTGSGEEFCSGGSCRNAVTPEGQFEIYREVQGWDSGPLGALYNPQYFNGGIAIHGATSVPAEPASHGCVRIPLNAAEWFPEHVSMGTPVFVMAGGQAEAVPQTTAASAQATAAAPQPTAAAPQPTAAAPQPTAAAPQPTASTPPPATTFAPMPSATTSQSSLAALLAQLLGKR